MCKHCKGKGWYWVQSGPDDYDKEPCDCEDYMKEGVEDGGVPNNEIGGS